MRKPRTMSGPGTGNQSIALQIALLRKTVTFRHECRPVASPIVPEGRGFLATAPLESLTGFLPSCLRGVGAVDVQRSLPS